MKQVVVVVLPPPWRQWSAGSGLTRWGKREREGKEVTQSCPTLCDPIDCKNTGVGCHFLLQGIFPTQGSNLGLPHCGQTLYHLRLPGGKGKTSVKHWRENCHCHWTGAVPKQTCLPVYLFIIVLSLTLNLADWKHRFSYLFSFILFLDWGIIDTWHIIFRCTA